MLANRRHEIIVNLLRTEGAVTVSHLVEEFDVSLETVRRGFCAVYTAAQSPWAK